MIGQRNSKAKMEAWFLGNRPNIAKPNPIPLDAILVAIDMSKHQQDCRTEFRNVDANSLQFSAL